MVLYCQVESLTTLLANNDDEGEYLVIRPQSGKLKIDLLFSLNTEIESIIIASNHLFD